MEVVQYVKQSEREIVHLLLPQHRPGLHALLQRCTFYELLHDVEGRGSAPPFEEVEDLWNPAVVEQR